MSKLKTGVISALLVAAMATPLVIQQRRLNLLSEANQALVEKARRAEALREENEKRAVPLTVPKPRAEISESQLSELLRLRGEVGLLRKENEELARQRAQQPAERPGPSAEEELKLEARRA